MAVSISTAPTLTAGIPGATALTPGGLGTSANYDVTADGQRFIVASEVRDSNNQPITVTVNWMAARRK